MQILNASSREILVFARGLLSQEDPAMEDIYFPGFELSVACRFAGQLAIATLNEATLFFLTGIQQAADMLEGSEASLSSIADPAASAGRLLDWAQLVTGN